MRTCDFAENYKNLLTPDIVSLLTQIHEYKGQQALILKDRADILASRWEIAKVQNTEAFSQMEGICIPDGRLKKLVQDKTTPRTHSEQQVAGYRDTLTAIVENFAYLPPKSSMILQLHRELYKFSGKPSSGSYKTEDHGIAESDIHGSRPVAFPTLPAQETPEAMDRLCQSYEEAVRVGEMDPLLLIPMFLLDFLCISPFREGNGTMSRLLTLLLLCRAGYFVGKYVSMEKRMAQSQETYYEAMRQSSRRWREGANDYAPFVKYTLSVAVAAYQELFAQIQAVSMGAMSKPDRIREIISGTPGKITKGEILAQAHDISQITVQRTLSGLQKSGEILKLSGGRYTAYIWNGEKE